MRYEYSTAVIVLVSMALLFLGMYAVMMFFENNMFSFTPEVLARFSDSIFNVWEIILPAVLCAAAGGVLTIISFVHTRKAVEFGKKHACTLNFFYDHLVIAEEGAEPLSLFYTNIKELVETDGYFIFKMQNKARFCVDKSELENPEELSKLLKSAKNYLDRRLSKTPTGMGKVKRCAVRISRVFFLYRIVFYAVLYNAYIHACHNDIDRKPVCKIYRVYNSVFGSARSDRIGCCVYGSQNQGEANDNSRRSSHSYFCGYEFCEL